jgi:hypothetical protein
MKFEDRAGEKILKALADTQEICKDRYETYGDPQDTYTAISSVTRAFLYTLEDLNDLGPETMISLEIIKKLVRAERNPAHLDSWKDIMGYAACGHAIAERKYGRG